MNILNSIILQAALDPHSKEFKILLITSEIVVTLIVFYGFYLVFNKFNKNLRSHRKENPELTRKRNRETPEKEAKQNN